MQSQLQKSFQVCSCHLLTATWGSGNCCFLHGTSKKVNHTGMLSSSQGEAVTPQPFTNHHQLQNVESLSLKFNSETKGLKTVCGRRWGREQEGGSQPTAFSDVRWHFPEVSPQLPPKPEPLEYYFWLCTKGLTISSRMCNLSICFLPYSRIMLWVALAGRLS